MESLFVYGVLKKASSQIEVLTRRLKLEKDSLKGYSLDEITIEGEKFPIAVKNPKGKVEGYSTPITKPELPVLDEFETDAYKRVQVELESGKTAWVYVADR